MTEVLTWQAKLAELCRDPEVKDVCPSERIDAPWAPSKQDVKLAWMIYVELSTRIATQPLPVRSGVETTALASLVKLFELARGAVKNHARAITSAALIIHSFNTTLRPFTARWHPKSESGELSSVDQRFIFRDELADVQKTLRRLAAVLGQMAGDAGAAAFLGPPKSSDENKTTSDGKLGYGVRPEGLHAREVKELNAAERCIINRRRGKKTELQDEVNNAVGLAISGGGIRSTTFALGVVQVLARRGVLKDVDVMSTVSGGGYLGSFITSMLNDPSPEVGLGANQEPFGTREGVETESVRYLRNHSKYLTEGGLYTFGQVLFSAAYGIVMSFILTIPAAWLAAYAAFLLGVGNASNGQALQPFLSMVPFGAWSLLGVSAFLLSMQRSPNPMRRKLLERSSTVLLILALGASLAHWVPDFYAAMNTHAVQFLAGTFILPFVLGVIALWSGARSVFGKVAWSALAGFGPLFFISGWLLCIGYVVRIDEAFGIRGLLAVTFVLCLYAWFGVNINFASLHLYYRNSLARTYLRRKGQAEAVERQLLSEANGEGKAPLHLINATVNLPSSKQPELRGRDADFFVFAQHFCGGPLVGWWPTKDLEKADGHLDLATAMAISGAAAAPRMGTLTSARYTALLALLNVRLGYWLRKPATSTLKQKLLHNAPGGLYFLREVTGLCFDEKSGFMNLSDGGHLENLGLYELLRRRCRYIVAIDGEADSEHAFGGLLTAIQMAKIDLGVRIEPKLNDLRAGENFKRAHFVMARVDYGCSEGGKPVHGLLLVIKLALTGDESETLMRYKREYPAFPHQSTAQQLFSETQFEAYRALGEHAADTAFHKLLAGGDISEISQWLCELEKRLLPELPVET